MGMEEKPLQSPEEAFQQSMTEEIGEFSKAVSITCHDSLKQTTLGDIRINMGSGAQCPGSLSTGILQIRMPEWAAISSSTRWSSPG